MATDILPVCMCLSVCVCVFACVFVSDDVDVLFIGTICGANHVPVSS